MIGKVRSFAFSTARNWLASDTSSARSGWPTSSVPFESLLYEGLASRAVVSFTAVDRVPGGIDRGRSGRRVALATPVWATATVVLAELALFAVLRVL